jgi:hypothetical protein
MRQTLVTVLVALLVGLSLGISARPTEAADLAPRWLDEDFGTGLPSTSAWRTWGWGTTGSGHDGPSLGTWLNIGEHGAAGGQVSLRSLAGRSYIDQAYFRYWLRLDDDFFIVPPSQGKLPGLAALNGTYRCLGGKQSTTRDPCWSARTVFSRDYPKYGEPGHPYSDPDHTLLGTYLYHLDVPARFAPYGEAVLWDPAVATLDHGRWYCVEGHVRMNTPGASDGVVRGWVDEQLALDRRDVRLRRAGESSLGVQTLWMDLYHGGAKPSAADNEVRIDSLALGPQRIGCADGAQHEGRFSDDDRSDHQDDIEWMVGLGLTTGCDTRRSDLFCPGGPVTRSQVAQFLADGLGLPDGTATFDDVTFPRAIRATAALEAGGVTQGCAPSLYCPNDTLSRGQLAAMVQRIRGFDSGAPLPGDVPESSPFATAIRTVVDSGVMPLCGIDRFCPTRPATREIVADVVHRLVLESTG